MTDPPRGVKKARESLLEEPGTKVLSGNKPPRLAEDRAKRPWSQILVQGDCQDLPFPARADAAQFCVAAAGGHDFESERPQRPENLPDRQDSKPWRHST